MRHSCTQLIGDAVIVLAGTTAHHMAANNAFSTRGVAELAHQVQTSGLAPSEAWRAEQALSFKNFHPWGNFSKSWCLDIDQGFF